MSMKRNCNNCKALDAINKYCTLGFRIQGHKDFEGITLSWKPLEECPKPKTYSKYTYLYNLKMQGRII